MVEGNAQMLPHGIWHFHPTDAKVSRLLLGTGLRLLGFAAVLTVLQQIRSLSWKYTHTTYLGRTMTLGNLTQLTHEPLSAEEIDKLKAKEAARKGRA